MNKWFLLCLLAFQLVDCDTIKYLETLSIPQLGRFSSKRDTSFSLEFQAHERTFQLDLERHSGFFADDAVFEYGPKEGEFESYDFDTSVYYQGNAKMGSDNGILSLRFHEETQSLHGILVGEQDNWMIESSSLHGEHEKPMVIYKWSDVEDEHKHECGTSESHGLQKNTTVPSMMEHLRNVHVMRQASSTCRISLVADSRFFRGFQSKVWNSLAHLMDIMTNVEAIYRSQNIGGFQVVSTRVFTDQNSDPYKDVATDAGKFLEAIQARRGDQGSNLCLTHGFTQAEWKGPVGLAYVGHTCTDKGGSGVTTAIVPGLRFMTIVTAHEIGHNFGSNHDDGNTPNFIMSPSVGGNDQKQQFSPSSLSQMNNRKNSGGFNCFINKPAVLGTCGNGWQDPGEECDCGTACNTDNFCTTACKLKNGATCSTANGPCCNSGQLAPRGQVCGPVPLPGIAAPSCNAVSSACPNCWPAGSHPNIYSNIKPCDLKRDCKAGCAWDNNPNQCVTCKGIGVITEENLPDGSCCSNGGRCKAGVCLAQTPVQPTFVPPVATSAAAPVPNTPTTNCAAPAAGGTGSGLVGRYFKGNNFNEQVLQRTDAVIAFDWNINSPTGTSLPADLFSIRWTGQVQTRFSGAWTFYTISDDGSRLWVNNVQLINDFVGHSKAQRSGGTSLTAGTKYNLKLEYFEGYVDAVIILQWSHACVKQENIPAAQLYPVVITTLDEGCAGYEGEGKGLKATYTASNGTVIQSGIEAPIDFHWMGIPADFGDRLNVVWEGFLQARYSEEYTFSTNSSSGVKLTVNGQLIINNWNKHNITQDSGTISLQGGEGTPIKIEFWHEGPNDNEGAISLFWSTPKCQSSELIGRDYFYESADMIPSEELTFSSASSLVFLVSFVLFFLF